MNKAIVKEKEDWTMVIVPKSGWWDLKLGDIWQYRDLLMLFVRRDFVAVYKQTVLGPLWFFIQPILTTMIFTVIFGRVAKIPTDGLPQVLFYMTGIVGWGYFASCFSKTSSTFTANAGIFGKVYFPRMIIPLSIIISNLIKFGVQFTLLLCFLFFYIITGANVNPNIYILLTPLLLLMMAGIGMGFGIIISSMTTKYRDLQFLVGFGVQLLMYVTPVVYPLSFLPGKYRWIILANPMTSIIETFKFSYLGAGTFNPLHLAYSFCFMVILLLIGLLVFHKVEKTFMDTV
ncbi:MAG: ABC transporter permease [Bacteroidota bacterium]